MRFKKIYIEITNTCNLACSFCIQNQRKPRSMSIEEFTHIINQIKPYTKYVYLHVLGEPLSHPHLQEFLNICDSAQIQVNLTTNGTMLEAKRDILLGSSLRQLNISVHSFPQHQQKQYLEQVLSIGKALAKQKTFISYRLWCLKDYQISEEIQSILTQICKAYQIELDEIKAGTYRLADYTFLHFDEVFEWPSMAHPLVGTIGRCHGMKAMCGILSDGTLVPCCLDSKGEAALGNVFDTPFQDLIMQKRAQAIVQGFQNQHIEEALCQHCSYRLRFSKSV